MCETEQEMRMTGVIQEWKLNWTQTSDVSKKTIVKANVEKKNTDEGDEIIAPRMQEER
jgi:hypothetical protein